jgi:hypothetical protein
MRKLAAALGVAALLATGGSAAKPARPAHHAEPNLCTGGERVVYSCQFGTRLGSVCLARKSIYYRFGKPGRLGLNLASTPDWSNVHTGVNRSQGGLNQDTIRFARGATHYVVHAGETGSLNEHPGRRMSGIVVLEGERAVASLACKARRPFRAEAFSAIPAAAPEGWDGAEVRGGPFDMIY